MAFFPSFGIFILFSIFFYTFRRDVKRLGGRSIADRRTHLLTGQHPTLAAVYLRENELFRYIYVYMYTYNFIPKDMTKTTRRGDTFYGRLKCENNRFQ